VTERKAAVERLVKDEFFGEIKFFRNYEGYGFITGMSGEEYFFLWKDVGIHRQMLLPGMPVSFSVVMDKNPKSGKITERAILIRELKK
jgi:cold shock CspA family protein